MEKLCVVGFIILVSVKCGLSIQCYDCNSHNNSMCLDPTLYDAETVSRHLASVQCQAGVYSPTQHEFFCRKIVQIILHKGHDSEVRVTRGCGWVRHHRECYTADNEDHLETVCQCFQDHCNDARRTVPRWTATLTCGVVLALLNKGVDWLKWF